MRVALALCALQCLNYGLNTISYRAVQRGSYRGVAVTDALIATFGFWMIGEVSHAQTLLPFAGYVLGGVVGSQLGMRASHWLERQDRECPDSAKTPSTART